jgi:LacI family transcriptional regulator
MAVTLKKIGAELGLSFQTVSAILNGNGDAYREETRARVLEAARRMGYRPHASARAMRARRCNSIALLTGDDEGRSYVFPSELRGIQDATAEAGLTLCLARLSDQRLTDRTFVPKLLRELLTDGLLISYYRAIPPSMTELIERCVIPCAWLNAKRAADAVYPDDFSGGRELTQYLIALGSPWATAALPSVAATIARRKIRTTTA